ncbi:hypothetical protein ACFL3V_01375 [Nanoarchaeota archaeon]
MSKEDVRKLVLFERMLGDYLAAGAIYSYGDAFGFFDGKAKGVVIADTCGHNKKMGDAMQGFLDDVIRAGWGCSGDAAHEVLDLGPRLVLAGTGKPELEKKISHLDYDAEWWSCLAVHYMSLRGDDVQLSGIGSYVFRQDMGFERYVTTLCPFHYLEEPSNEFEEMRRPVKTSLGEGDFVLLASDGLEHNIGTSLYRGGNDSSLESVQELLVGSVLCNHEKSAVGIRDALVYELSRYFVPQEGEEDPLRYFDDVTFVVVKKVR